MVHDNSFAWKGKALWINFFSLKIDFFLSSDAKLLVYNFTKKLPLLPKFVNRRSFWKVCTFIYANVEQKSVEYLL